MLTWDVGTAAAAFASDVDVAIAAATERHVADTLTEASRSMVNALSGPTLAILDAPPDDMWPRLHTLFARGIERATQRVVDAIEGYDVPPARVQAATASLQRTAQAKLETHVREAANTALSRLRDRFNERFARDERGVPRAWGPRVNIPQLAAAARAASGRLLAQLAVVRDADASYEDVDAFAAALVAGGASSVCFFFPCGVFSLCCACENMRCDVAGDIVVACIAQRAWHSVPALCPCTLSLHITLYACAIPHTG